MPTHHGERKKRLKLFLIGSAGVFLGGMFLWLATRNMDPAVVETTLRQADVAWLIIGIVFYLLSIGLRCLRWGILLRATGDVKWRHAAEADGRYYRGNCRPDFLLWSWEQTTTARGGDIAKPRQDPLGPSD
jgi:hypothetical protein